MAPLLDEAEAEWVRQLAGDETAAVEAFNRIYCRYQPKLTHYITAFVKGDDADTREIVQLLFVRLWKKRMSLTGVRILERYLYRMARNATLNFLYQQKNREQKERSLGAATTGNPVEAEITLREYHQIALQAIDRLPDRRRELFLLSTRDDLSLNEICQRTGLSKEVVKKQLYLAGRAIKDYLRKHSDFFLLFF